MKPEKTFKRKLLSILQNDASAEVMAFLGNHSGTVIADTDGMVYVTLLDGDVITVYNGKVPNISRLPVMIGKAGSKRIQITRARDVYSTPPYPEIAPHAFLHTFPGADAIPIRGEQFLPLLVEPYSGLTIYIHGGYYELEDGWHALPSQTLDLSAHVPASGAIYVRIEVDATGAISVTDGTAVSSRAVLEYSNIPTADSAKFSLAAVKLYFGQTSMLFQAVDTDIIDLRFGRRGGGGGGGTPGGSDTEIQYNSSGAFEGDPEFTWDDVTKALGIGDPADLPAISPDHTFWMVGDGVSPSIFKFAYGATKAPFITFGKADGSVASPTNVKDDQVIGRIRGWGYDGAGWTDTRIEIRFVADGDWGSGDTPTRIELWTCPDGSSTLTLAMTIGSDGNVNIASGKEYRVNGAQHTHTGLVTNGDSHDHSGGDGAPIPEGGITLSDVTTLNASTTKHGLLLKATAPSSGLRNIVAIDNGETGYKNTALLDNTNPTPIGTATPGTSLLAARRDHVHAPPTTIKGRFFLPWGAFGNVGWMSATSDPYGATIDRAMTAINFAISGIVLTTNNSSNYWRIYISYVGSTSFSCEVNTSGKSAGAWWNLSTASFTGSLDANTIGIFVEVAKVGSPGNILVFGPALEVEIT